MNTWFEIVQLAEQHIRNQGYNAFSYGDLSVIMDVRPAAIHYHFRNKCDLGREVIRQELFRLSKYRKYYGDLPGDEQLKHLVTIFYKNCRSKNICLMGSLTGDFATFDPAMQKSVQELCKSITDWATSFLEQGRREGNIKFEGAASDRALLVMSTLMSSLLMARVLGESVFERMLNQLLEDLGAGWRIGDLELAEQGDPHSYT